MINRLLSYSLLALALLTANAQNIHRTACSGDLVRLDSMLQHSDLHVLDDRGRTLLHWAVGCNKKVVFDTLVARGIEINKLDNDGHSALYVALQFNRDTLMEKLITLQQNDQWIAEQGGLLMERAILDQKLTYVQTLIEKGVDIEQVNERGSTPLELANRVDAREISSWLLANGADPSKVREFTAAGPYMGQSPPGQKSVVFAPNFISTEEYEYGSVFNKAGTEFYYAIAKNDFPVIRYTHLVNGSWTAPKTILADERYGYNDPFLSPDEDRLYFISKRSLDGTEIKDDHDIWYVEKTSEGSWSEPINAGPNINSEGNEYYISFTKSGTMYFASNVNAPEERKRSDQDIYYAPMVEGEFQEAVNLGDSINTEHYEADVFVDPEESYLIFCATRPEGMGRGDLYISFKNEDDSWSKAQNMGTAVNTEGHELCPFVTADGKYLFYTSQQDIVWISTSIFDQLRE